MNFSKYKYIVAPLLIGGGLVVGGLFLDDYLIYLATSWICFGILAVALSIIWGGGGILSFGHTVFFGIGGYLYALLSINLLPIVGGGSVYMGIVAGVVGGGVAAAIIAYFMFYGRLGELQIAIITYTLVLLAGTIAVGWSFKLGAAKIGGANGVTGIPGLTLGFRDGGAAELETYGVYGTSVVIGTVIFILASMLRRSRFGRVINATRQDLDRTELLGYDVRWYRFLLFTVSGAIAGVGGALYAAWAAYVSPSLFSTAFALLVPMYVLVGGLGTLTGGLIGVVAISALSFWLGSGAGGGQTTLILGFILIAVVLFAPRGLWGIGESWMRLLRQRKADGKEEGAKSKQAAVETAGSGKSRESDTSVLSRLFAERAVNGELLHIKGLTKRFGGVLANDAVTLSLPANQLTCLIGPNGAGKSTFIKLCLGLLESDSGEIVFDEIDITRWPPCRRARAGIGIKMQNARVLPEVPVEENVRLALQLNPNIKEENSDLVIELLELVGLSNKSGIIAGNLPHGEHQWLDFLMSVCGGPRLLFLDEPVAGMTAPERKKMIDLLRVLQRLTSILVVEHDMEFVRALNSQVIVLHRGALFRTGSLPEIQADQAVRDIYLGNAL